LAKVVQIGACSEFNVSPVSRSQPASALMVSRSW
jgi:hypothetical protein